jgi:hypothetical protein
MTIKFGLKSPEPEKIVRAAAPTGTFTLVVEYVAGNGDYTQVRQGAISCSSPVTITDPDGTYTLEPSSQSRGSNPVLGNPPPPILITITGPNSVVSLILRGQLGDGSQSDTAIAKIGKITGSFPTGLDSLTMWLGTDISFYPTIPATCTSVDFGNSRGLNYIYNLPSGLTALAGLPPTLTGINLSRCTALTTLPTLPTSVANLLMFPKYTSGVIPSTITDLDLGYCNLMAVLPSLPTSVISLRMFPKYTTGVIPSTIIDLDLSLCTAMAVLPSLPSSIIELTMFPKYASGPIPSQITRLFLNACTNLSVLPVLPTGLVSLRIDNTKIKVVNLTGRTSLTTLRGLPPSCTSLNLTGCTSLTILAAPPASCTSLNLTGCTSLTSVPALPAKCNTLNLTNCTGITKIQADPAVLKTLICTGSGIVVPSVVACPSGWVFSP